ncbi:uncharacterized protein BDZ99DRAFT_522963 [Mytilinidion resinicola]|uniref:Uncharacterized protein n=1 Tax=Mytilinidion resinicola TaxID=574789 RepID=A0A6A6YHH4_9PEZI|nr:uncharacterized protein BDZ99DRAFT_522963 [Mytilinidion resinicola]KAF2807347.1 hypothetical protein BDZ99DRAFT_522963 [Mytilinidion resinicola]
MPDQPILRIYVTGPDGITNEAPETRETAKTPGMTANEAIKHFTDVKEYIPTDFAGHPGHHSSNPTVARAMEIAELHKKASTVSTDASAHFRNALKGFEQANKLFREATEHIPMIHAEKCKRTIISATNLHTQAKICVLPASAEARKFHVLAMAWYAEAQVLAKSENTDQDDQKL